MVIHVNHVLISKRLTLLNLLCTQEYFSSLGDAKQDVGMVILDLSKAFDVVDYQFPRSVLVILNILVKGLTSFHESSNWIGYLTSDSGLYWSPQILFIDSSAVSYLHKLHVNVNHVKLIDVKYSRPSVDIARLLKDLWQTFGCADNCDSCTAAT